VVTDGIELIDRVVAEGRRRRGTLCGATTRSGAPCRAFVTSAWSSRCRHHGGVGAPTRRAERARRQRAAELVIDVAAKTLTESLTKARGRRRLDLSVAVLALALGLNPAALTEDAT